jgi:hypothetical protein
MTAKLRHRGAANIDMGGLRVKTIICDIEDAEEGVADAEVNDFCSCHEATAIVLDRYNGKMIYRILYRDED